MKQSEWEAILLAEVNYTSVGFHTFLSITTQWVQSKDMIQKKGSTAFSLDNTKTFQLYLTEQCRGKDYKFAQTPVQAMVESLNV